MITIKEPVKIRTKKLAEGVESLYLDIYYDGHRKKEYLKLYLVPETSREAKRKNKETMSLANTIKAERIMQLQVGKYDFMAKKASDIDLVEYLESMHSDYSENCKSRTARLYRNLTIHTKGFIGRKKVKLKDVDKEYVKGFIKYLSVCVGRYGEVLKESTQRTYYAGFVRALNRAVEEELINSNPCNCIKSNETPKAPESKREYLTFEEVKKLIDTPCKPMRIKQIFLFSCFTGLRIGDIQRIERKNIVEVEKDVWQLEFVQQKTERVLTVPLSENALAWLPDESTDKNGKVFWSGRNAREYEMLSNWVKKAGIKKHVTFHIARHTYATLLLYFGADVYTVSKLLGHTNVNTTQIYAKVMDESKRKAVKLIPKV